MRTVQRVYPYTDERIREGINSLVENGPYMPTALSRQGKDIGVLSANGSRMRVSIENHEVAATLIEAGEDEATVLKRFLHDLNLRMEQRESHGKKPSQEPIAEAAAPMPISAPAEPLAEPFSPSSVIDSAAAKWAMTVRAAIRGIPRLVRWGIAALLAIVVMAGAYGLGFQSGYDTRIPSQQPEYINMVKKKSAEIHRLSTRNEKLSSDNSSKRVQIDSLRKFKDEYDQRKTELDQRQAELDKRSSDLDSRENALKQRESAASSATQSEQTYSYGSASGSTSSQTGTSSYYKNCSAARAAGAAPLHRGDPGYRAALDRDGDGIACEWS